jgi:hypothetical protein
MNSDFQTPNSSSGSRRRRHEGKDEISEKSQGRKIGSCVPQSCTPYAVFPHCDLIYQGHSLKHISRMLFFLIAGSDPRPSSP